jgi:Spy/CpxP family protein refolding chaperone
MSQFSKWKTIGYAAAIFVTGGISGGALGVYEARTNLFATPQMQDVAGHLRTRLQTKLGLSPDQMQQINPIIESATSQIRSIRMETWQRVNKVFDDSYSQISAILTPDQRVKFDEMQKERRAWMQTHWQENHHHPGDAGGSPPNSPPQ